MSAHLTTSQQGRACDLYPPIEIKDEAGLQKIKLMNTAVVQTPSNQSLVLVFRVLPIAKQKTKRKTSRPHPFAKVTVTTANLCQSTVN